MIILPQIVLLKNCCCARLMKLFTVHGAMALSSSRPMSPKLVEMVALIVGGLVATLPVGGGLTCLMIASLDWGYWQLAPSPGGGANAGNPGTGEPGPAPGLGALARVECAGFCAVALLALLAEPLCDIRLMTRAITAANA